MRPDMQSVIIERPRVGGHGFREPPKPDYLQEYADDRDSTLPQKEGMAKRYGYERKEQTDVLGPLYGFLHKNVGRPWNQVWSEICAHCRGFMGEHLKTHVRQLVVTSAKIVDGKVLDSRGYEVRGSRYWEAFYVHPETGVLTQAPPARWNKYRRTPPKSKIVTLGKQEYYKHNGVWYRVKTAPMPKQYKDRIDYSHRGPGIRYHWLLAGVTQKYGIPRDVFGVDGMFLSYWEMENTLVRHYGIPVYCVSKEQAGKKECRKLNSLYIDDVKQK